MILDWESEIAAVLLFLNQLVEISVSGMTELSSPWVWVPLIPPPPPPQHFHKNLKLIGLKAFLSVHRAGLKDSFTLFKNRHI